MPFSLKARPECVTSSLMHWPKVSHKAIHSFKGVTGSLSKQLHAQIKLRGFVLLEDAGVQPLRVKSERLVRRSVQQLSCLYHEVRVQLEMFIGESSA